YFGTIRPRDIRASVEDVARLATAPPLSERTERSVRELDDGEDDAGADMSRFASPVGGGGPLGRLLKRMFRAARSPGAGPAGHDAPTHRSRHNERPGTGAASSTARADRAPTIETPERRGVTYPEWDLHRRRYRPDWCTVIEIDAPAKAE